MKKNFIKITLDIIMTILLVLMYSKVVISLQFHEIGGLIVFGLFIIHILINWKWVVSVSKRLFDKNLPAKTKLGYVLDVLLLICMTFIIISGILISKILFPGIFNVDFIWMKLHYFAAAIAIVIVGIHVGLHWTFIKGVFVKIIKLPAVIAKPLSIICLVVIIIFGGYSIGTSSFTNFLTGPFLASTGAQHEGAAQGGRRPAGMTQGQRPTEAASSGVETQNGNNPQGMQGGHPAAGPVSIGNILKLIATYCSITFLFSILTVLIEKSLKRRRKTAATAKA